LGVSYFIKAEGKNIFHSGDLNWWDWDTKIRPNINPEIEERDFKMIIKKIELQSKEHQIDVAFVPVDPRLGGSAYRAAEYFINILKPKILIPMHFWEDFSVIKTLHDREIDSDTIIPLFEDRNKVIGNY
ncbi:MAG: MBL fold metallo-hydrolase, partial [Eubacterium sp.]